MSYTRSADYAATLLRLGLGTMFLAHAGLKIFVFGIAGTAGFFQSIGYPAALAYLVIAAEALGGAALIVGLWTRWVALALVPIMVGATLQHIPNGWLFSGKGGGWEFPVFWTVTLFVQALLGDGVAALRPGTAPRARPAIG